MKNNNHPEKKKKKSIPERIPIIKSTTQEANGFKKKKRESDGRTYSNITGLKITSVHEGNKVSNKHPCAASALTGPCLAYLIFYFYKVIIPFPVVNHFFFFKLQCHRGRGTCVILIREAYRLSH